MKFSELNLHEHLLNAIEGEGFENPTLVQEKSIPHIMEGRDIMSCAQTGTGKTASFTLPVINRLLLDDNYHRTNAPRVLVLTPTRELADQVLTSIKFLLKIQI